MNLTAANVLLLGDAKKMPYLLQRHLEKRGCRCWCATSVQDALTLCKQHDFFMVLNTGPISWAKSMIDRIEGTNCHMFATFPVEDSCLWLQFMDCGRRCSGVPALRPSEFTVALDQLLQEMSLGAIALHQPSHVGLPSRFVA